MSGRAGQGDPFAPTAGAKKAPPGIRFSRRGCVHAQHPYAKGEPLSRGHQPQAPEGRGG